MTPIIDGSFLKQAFPALVSAQSVTDQARVVHAINRRVLRVPLTDGGTAGTGVAEEPVDTNYLNSATGATPLVSNTLKLIAAAIICPVAVALNGANFVTFNVFYRTAAGGGQVAQASFNTSATNLVAFAPQALTISGSTLVQPNAALVQPPSPGDVLTVSAVKSGTGVAFASATGQAFLIILIEEQ